MLRSLRGIILLGLLIAAPATEAASATSDTTPPTITIKAPGRGEFLAGAAQVTVTGTAHDGESGIARLEVNGLPVALDASGAFATPVTLEFGVNIFTAKATDGAGNVAHVSWSALYSPDYLPPGALVENAAAARVSEDVIDAIAPSIASALVSTGALKAAIAAAAGATAGPLRIDAFSFGPPSATVTLVEGGLRTAIDIPNLEVAATLAGRTLTLFAESVRVDGVLLVSVEGGAFVASMPVRPRITFTSVDWTGPRAQGLVARALAAAIETSLPPRVATALQATIQPRSFTIGSITMTVEARPRALAIDPDSIVFALDADVVAPRDPTVPPAPGSVSRLGRSSTAPTFDGSHDLAVALHEDLINRAAFAAWQAGAGRVRIDKDFLAAAGINLPFPLDSSLLLPFFPALAALLPGGGPMPIAFELDPGLPPVVEVTGAPSLLTAGVGELHLALQLDLGQGFASILTVVVHAQMGADVDLVGGTLRIVPGAPTRLEAALLANPLGLAVPDVVRFLEFGVPLVVELAGGLIPPVPLPLPPAAFQLSNLSILPDGEAGDFVTIGGDAR